MGWVRARNRSASYDCRSISSKTLASAWLDSSSSSFGWDGVVLRCLWGAARLENDGGFVMTLR